MEALNFGYNHDKVDAQLPLGFKFYPIDEELITHYLMRKVLDNSLIMLLYFVSTKKL